MCLMVKLKKSEGYLIDSDEKLLNKFELHQLISEKNKNKKISKLHQFIF